MSACGGFWHPSTVGSPTPCVREPVHHCATCSRPFCPGHVYRHEAPPTCWWCAGERSPRHPALRYLGLGDLMLAWRGARLVAMAANSDSRAVHGATLPQGRG